MQRTILFTISVLVGPLLSPYCSLKAAPIQLNASSLITDYSGCQHFSASGTNFNLTSGSQSGCAGNIGEATFGQTFPTAVTIYAPPFEMSNNSLGLTEGNISAPGVLPTRTAVFTGLIQTQGPNVTVPASPGNSIQLQAPLTVTGTLTACLLPELHTTGPCDPDYLNVATVNINLTGTITVSGACFSAIATCIFSDETFTADAAAVPEPASVGYLAFASVAFVAVGVHRKRQTPLSSRTC